MILCPNCQYKNLDGALFCYECGAQLIVTDDVSTRGLTKPPDGSNGPQRPSEEISDRPSTGFPMVAIHVVESGQMLQLSGRLDYTFGRVTEDQPILPDVDLAPFGAFSQGVSRLHALIKIIGQQVLIMDLGSSNGTRVNGQLIISQVEYPLNHGDMLTLGRMRLQVIIR